jgi:hypothetical protein
MKYLYPNFLNDPAEYSQAKQYWESFCFNLLGSRASDWEHWLGNMPDEDGNPIFAVRSRRKRKIVRIIQVPPNEGHLPITSWTDTFGSDLPGSIKCDELVIQCVLSEETAKAARVLFQDWVDNAYCSDP